MLADHLPAMCPDCGAGDNDLRLTGQAPGVHQSFHGPAIAVTVCSYVCAKCGKTFRHDIEPQRPQAGAASPVQAAPSAGIKAADVAGLDPLPVAATP